MPKDAQSLEESRDIRSFLLQRYGLEPRSIMKEDWRTKTHKKYTTYAQQKIANDPKGSPFSLSGVGARHGSLSDFPHTIARFILKFFCYDGLYPRKLEEPGYFGNYLPTILDPFAGHNCIPAGTGIITLDGLKNVEDIAVGDNVLTHRNRFRPVVKLFDNGINNVIVLKIAGNPKLRLTAGHPVLAVRTNKCPYGKENNLGRFCLFETCDILKAANALVRKQKGEKNYRGTRKRVCKEYFKEYYPEFVRAGELKPGDFVCFPIMGDVVDTEYIRVDDIVGMPSLAKSQYRVFEECIVSKGPHVKLIKNKILVNENFMRLCGYYVAEGGLSGKDSIHFTFGAGEDAYADDVVSLLELCFGAKTQKKSCIEDHTIRIVVSSTVLNRFFKKMFGGKSPDKKLPQFFMTLPYDKQKQFLRGYFSGDGCVDRGKSGGARVIVTTSSHLAYQTKIIMARLGMKPSVYLPKTPIGIPDSKWGIISRHQAYYISIVGQDIYTMDKILGLEKDTLPHTRNFNSFIRWGYLCHKVLSIDISGSEKVYNFEVAEDNSYSSLQCALHNSRFEDVYSCGLNYLGHDICAEFMKANREIRDELLAKNAASMLPTNAQIQIYEGDSRAIINYNQVADFLITSPPFWNIEDYGPEAGQLGHSKLYTDFITDLTTVFKNCYQALKPGSFAAVEVNDFREDGVFYCYHADTIAALKSVGFLMHDVIIIDYGSAFLSAFLSDVEHSKIMPKLHSYLLIAKRKSELRGLLRAETREKLKEMVAERNATTGFVGQAKML